MIGDVVKDIYGVKITKKGSKYSYTPVKIQTRVWEEKMNLYPIAQSEIYKKWQLNTKRRLGVMTTPAVSPLIF